MASENEPQDERSIRATALALAGIGMMNAVAAVGGCALGWLADAQLGTTPVFILLGLVLGLACGVLVTRREVRDYLGQDGGGRDCGPADLQDDEGTR